MIQYNHTQDLTCPHQNLSDTVWQGARMTSNQKSHSIPRTACSTYYVPNARQFFQHLEHPYARISPSPANGAWLIFAMNLK